jgi:glycosyltransferase involved in cell wall biosynthesis
MRIVTVVSAAALARARVLAAGVARHHPGQRLLALCLTPTGDREPFDVVRLEQIGLPKGRAPAIHEWPAFAALMPPAFVRWLLDQGDEPVVFLDPSVDVLAPLDTVASALRHDPVVLVRRLADLAPDDDLRPREIDYRKAGLISTACLAATPSTDARECLDWLVDGLQLAARLPSDEGLTQWLDLLPSRFATEVGVVDEPGMLASTWNLHERHLRRAPGGRITIDWEPLRTIHFDGFDPERPYWLSRLGNRVRVVDDPILVELCVSYAERLKSSGGRDFTRADDVGRMLANGMPFEGRLKHLHDEALLDSQDFGDLFSVEGTERFMAWLKAPAPEGAAAGLTRYLYRVYWERPDIAVAYPDLDADGDEFAGWCWVFGQTEMGIPPAFLPPRPSSIDGAALLAVGEERGRVDPVDLAVNVAGYFTGAFGLGAAARMYLSCLQREGIPVSTTTVEVVHPEDIPGAPAEDYGRVRFSDLDEASHSRFNVVLVNPEELGQFADVLGEEFFADRISIGVWAWETDFIPDYWDERFELFDEIWVYSRFVAENLSRASPVPVVPIPIPIVPPDAEGEELEVALPEGFRFLFMFDFNSTAQRKNPLGLIEAFKRAFAPGKGPQLIIKTLHAHHHLDRYDALRFAFEGRADIHLIDESLSRPQRDALIIACDAFVSLHRSEGFGLGLAEAMAVGKPVIGTAYGGNVDFMTPSNSYLVGWSPTKVGPEGELYPAGGTWAEPDLDHAASLMRHVVVHPDEAAAKGLRARSDIARDLSVSAVGARVRERLERIALRASRRSAATRD